MPSRLSSLLVRDGLVGVKRMEKAFQRQVIYGGTLDTILLEMNLIPEERLLQYLSLSTGVPPATRAETDVFDAAAVKMLAQELAEKYMVAPLSYDGETLRVVVKEPVDFGILENCANELGLPIQPLVVPEYRFHVVFDRAYDRDDQARFAALASRSRDEASTTPVGKPATVIVDALPRAQEKPDDDEDGDVDVVDVPLPPSSKATLPMGAVPEEVAAASSSELTQPRAQVVGGELHARPINPSQPGPPTSTIKVASPKAVTDRHAVVRPPEDILDPSPLTPAEAQQALASADNRDAVFGALLRAVRGRTWYAGLLTVQGGVAIGRTAIAGSEVDRERIGSVIIPLDIESAIRKVVDSGAPYIGPIASGREEVDGMIQRMGGVVPPTALLLPVSLRDRVVAIVLGHRGADRISIAELSDVLPLAGATAEAISRLIIKAKKVGYRPARDESAPHIRPELLESEQQKFDNKPTEEWKAPRREETAPNVNFGRAGHAPRGSIRAISDLLDEIERDEDPGGSVTNEVLKRGAEAVAVLSERFPGRLSVDRYSLGARPLRAERHGPLLGLVVKLGTASANMLVQKMRDPNRDVRYYATLCASELRPKSALRELVERLFDSDYGVRVAAVDALSGYPTRELEQALEGARRALHADDPDRVHAAATALGELSDVRAIPDLLDTLSRGGKVGQSVQAALVTLTRQDYGTSTRKWRSWWTKNRDKSRVEWLLESLNHKTSSLREGAAEDLRRLTGEYFGYHHDLPKKERDQARKKWEQWWNETGRRRFLREPGDESQRPTAVIQARDNEQ